MEDAKPTIRIAASSMKGLPQAQKRTQKGEGQEPTAKRPKTEGNAFAAATRRGADAETALEVDVMILDYLAYQATTACFASREAQSSPISLPHNLSMTDTFLRMFKHKHASYVFDAELRFRLLLLKFAALFTQRLTRNPSTPSRSALRQLREANSRRAMEWIGSAERIPSAKHDTTAFDDASSFPNTEQLERNRAHVLYSLHVPAEDDAYEDAFYGTSECVSLLDLLPLFMQVSAARNAISESYMTEAWMNMAAELLLQAVLEQYLVCGQTGSDAVDEAFAWGHKIAVTAEKEGAMEVDGQDGEGDIVDEVNVMFTDAVYETEVGRWTTIKRAYLDQLMPTGTEAGSAANNGKQPTHTLLSRLEALATTHPNADLEITILSFLEALSQSIPLPILTQVENGQLDGMSKADTQDFLQSCGLSVARFYQEPMGFKGPAGD